LTIYNTVNSRSAAHINAWNGQIECATGCDCSTDADLSRDACDGGTIPLGATRSYEPYTVVTRKSPKLENPGERRVLWSDRVKMTPYYVDKVTTRNFLLEIPMAGYGIYRFCSKRARRVVVPPDNCSNDFCAARELQQSMGTWNEVYDYEAFRERAGNPVYRSYLSDGNVVSLISETRSEAVSKSFRDYDALTDLLQFKQTALEFSGAMSGVLSQYRRFISGQSDADLKIAARMAPRDLLKAASRSLRKLGSLWLAYRYTIMPLTYSFKDILKVLSGWQITQDRSTKRISPYSVDPGTLAGYQILVDETGEIKVGSTVVCKYTSDKLAQAGKTSVNIFNTAWELIPYSFVADWFVNFGDTINSLFSLDLAESVGCCTAIRTRKTTTYTGIYTRSSTVYPGAVDSPWLSTCWPTPLPSRNPAYLTTVQGVLRTIEIDSYSRSLFNRMGAVKLIWNPNLNWRRWVDSAALSNNQLRGIMRLRS